MYLFFSLVTSFLMLSFPIYSSPVYYCIMMFMCSIYVVFFLSVFISSWYSYMLFLVYVGGLLVLFMYVCLMNSNDSLKKVFPNLVLLLFITYFLNSLFISDVSPSFLGFSSYESSYYLDLSSFFTLVMILLMTLFIIVRVINLKKSLAV
uniref:NADH dehydrogenase subunit 6 n=1 Tax=Planorbis carinatus TaxID=446412 RepID=A0A7D6W8F7_9GAST|nr:NADH dehydrogenase subunit 6 [Planorbis carinatus]